MAYVFVSMCGVFVATHLPRLALAVYAKVNAAAVAECLEAGMNYAPRISVVCAEAVSNLLILVSGF